MYSVSGRRSCRLTERRSGSSFQARDFRTPCCFSRMRYLCTGHGSPVSDVNDDGAVHRSVTLYRDKKNIIRNLSWAEFQLPNVNVSVSLVRLKIEIHEIQQICEIDLSKYRNSVRLCEIICLKVEIPHAHAHTHTERKNNFTGRLISTLYRTHSPWKC